MSRNQFDRKEGYSKVWSGICSSGAWY